MSGSKTYIVHRAMHGDGRDYARGDERQMTEADAVSLVASGALALKGEVPVERGAPVQHLFGTAPTEERTYISAATGEPAQLVGDVGNSDTRVEGRRNPTRGSK